MSSFTHLHVFPNLSKDSSVEHKSQWAPIFGSQWSSKHHLFCRRK